MRHGCDECLATVSRRHFGVARVELVTHRWLLIGPLGMYRELRHERLTHSVIAAFYEVYNTLGCGLLEHLYMAAMERELLNRGHKVSRELSVRVTYKDEDPGSQRLDMVVDDVLVIEAKATHTLHPSASRQRYNYLRATNLELGLLLHFGPRPQFHRVICENDFKARPS
jgi:GxxExxY protein